MLSSKLKKKKKKNMDKYTKVLMSEVIHLEEFALIVTRNISKSSRYAGPDVYILPPLVIDIS